MTWLSLTPTVLCGASQVDKRLAMMLKYCRYRPRKSRAIMPWYANKPSLNQLTCTGRFAYTTMNQRCGQRNDITEGTPTSVVRSAPLSRACRVAGYHHILTCSEEWTILSKSFTIASKDNVCDTSFRWNARCTSICMVRIRPVLPSPHMDAMNKSGRSVLEHRTIFPSAKSSVRAMTLLEMTPKLIPVPCVAVVTMPATVWSDMDPTLIMARLNLAKAWCNTLRVTPASAMKNSLSELIWGVKRG